MFHNKRGFKLPPFIKPEMLNENYWIDKLERPDETVIDSHQVIELNNTMFSNMSSSGYGNYMVDLKKYPTEIKKQDVLALLNEAAPEQVFPEDLICHSGNFEGIKKNIIMNTASDEIEDRVIPEPAVLVKRSNVRSLPTEMIFSKADEKVDMDRIQQTALPLGSPVLVIHRSADKNWSLIISRLYFGWVKSENIALAKHMEEIFKYEESKEFIVVTGSTIETEPNPFIPEISNLFFQMGDKIPLLNSKDIPDSIPENNLQAQSPFGCYAVKVPVRDENGYLKYVPALIAGSCDVNTGHIKYSRKNLLSQAFKMLGERYGWGGSLQRRDCSKFVMDIYRTVGIELPRDTGTQEKGSAGEIIEFSGDRAERLEIMKSLEAGDAIYMPGHVMLYLGISDGKHYVIHAGAGYGVKDTENKLKPVTVHGVFVMDVETSLMRRDKAYLESFTCARKFR